MSIKPLFELDLNGSENNYRVFQKFVPIESCTLYETFYVSLGKIQLGQMINLSN